VCAPHVLGQLPVLLLPLETAHRALELIGVVPPYAQVLLLVLAVHVQVAAQDQGLLAQLRHELLARALLAAVVAVPVLLVLLVLVATARVVLAVAVVAVLVQAALVVAVTARVVPAAHAVVVQVRVAPVVLAVLAQVALPAAALPVAVVAEIYNERILAL